MGPQGFEARTDGPKPDALSWGYLGETQAAGPSSEVPTYGNPYGPTQLLCAIN